MEGRGTSKRQLILLVFSAGLLACVAVQRGEVQSLDGRFMIDVAEKFLNEGTIRGPFSEFGIQGLYSKFAPGMSLLALAALVLEGSNYSHESAFWVTLINPVFSAATGAVLVLLTLRMGLGERAGVMAAGVIVLASPLLHYSTEFFSEPAMALFTVMAVLFVLDNRSGSSRSAIALGVTLAVSVLFRADAVLTLALPCVLFLPYFRRTRLWAGLVLIAAPMAVAGAVTMAHNHIRYKSVFDFGYTEGFQTGLGEGLYGLILSPGKGVVFFFPAILVALAGMAALGRRDLGVTGLVASLMLVRLLFFAMWDQWHGGIGWGPRFLVPAVALAGLPLACAFDDLRGAGVRRAAGRVIAGTLVFFSFAVSFLSVTVPYELIWDGNPGHIRHVPQVGVTGEEQRAILASQIDRANNALDGGVFDMTIDELINGEEPSPLRWLRAGTPEVLATLILLSAALWLLAGLLARGDGAISARSGEVAEGGGGDGGGHDHEAQRSPPPGQAEGYGHPGQPGIELDHPVLAGDLDHDQGR